MHDPQFVDTYMELQPAGASEGEDADQLLYHYTTATAALDHILPGRTLRLSPYSAMRDPLESRDIPRLVRFTGTMGPGCPTVERVQKELIELRDCMRILSLTMDATGYEDE